MNSAKYNVSSTTSALQSIAENLRKEIGDFKLAEDFARICDGKIYVYFDGWNYKMFVKVSTGTYFCVDHKCCYDINDNLVENDPRFYDWTTYRRMFPGKSLVIEDYFSPIHKE